MNVDWLQVVRLPLRMAHGLQVIRSADALARRGHLTRVFLRGRGAGEALEAALGRPAAEGLSAVELPSHKGLAGLAMRATILDHALRGTRAGARRAWLAREHSLASFALGAARVLRSRAALVYELHNLEHVLAAEGGREAESRALLETERRLARDAHGLVAISAPLAADAVAALGATRTPSIVPDAVDPRPYDALAEPRCLERPPFRIAYAGSLYGHKGVDTLLDMAEELARVAAGRFVLSIAGGEPASELERLRARARELASRGARGEPVELFGSLDPREVPAFLRRADLIVLPAGAESRSQRYTSPLKLFEALASGVPIVAAPSEAHASVLREARCARLATGCSGAELARAVLAAADDPEGSRALARRARAEAERYTWERRAEGLEAALLAALAARGAVG